MRHVVVMSMSSSIGILALFMVDLIDMYFLSLLGEIELASAIGYAGSILFFTTSVCIGLSIAIGAVVSRSIGAKNPKQAGSYLVNGYVVTIVLTSLLALLVWFTIPFLIDLLGAKGRTAELAIAYLRILIPTMPVLGIGMSSGAVLRAVGDARRSMMSTLAGGAVNAVFDPIFIFGLNMGVEGAATASVFARFTILAVAFYPVWKHHRLLVPFDMKKVSSDLKDIFTIALPAIITNVATPIGTAYVTSVMATFGDSAVAGMSITGRLTPVAFGIVFAVSGAVGPIIGQNFGAKLISRVRGTIRDSLLFVTLYVSAISVVLFLIPDWIGQIFQMNEEAQEIIDVFCQYVSITYILAGATFIGNASFNNLGKPNYSTIVNVGKATIGTIPFVYFGGQWFGAAGVILGQAAGSCVFGIISIFWAFTLVNQLKTESTTETAPSIEEGQERRHSVRDNNVAVKQCP